MGTPLSLENREFAALGGPPARRGALVHTDTPSLCGLRVLVVDDDEANREVTQRILEMYGAVVTTRCDGAAAVEYVRDHPGEVQVVLMDVQMPVMDGNEAVRWIRKHPGNMGLSVIGLTGAASSADQRRSLDSGMNEIVTKPFDAPHLARLIQRYGRGNSDLPLPLPAQRQAAVPQTDCALPEALDSAVIVANFGDDLPFLHSVLAQLLSDYADWALPRAVADEELRADSVLRSRAHTLKGAAGLLGATEIMDLSGKIEAAFEGGGSASHVEDLFSRMAVAFSSLIEQLHGGSSTTHPVRVPQESSWRAKSAPPR